MNLYERYLELKRKAKEAMVNGELGKYMQLLIEAEQVQLILIKANQ